MGWGLGRGIESCNFVKKSCNFSMGKKGAVGERKGVGVNEKGVPCAKVILSLRCFVYALATYDVVDKIMVTNTASPTVKPLTFFIAHVVY